MAVAPFRAAGVSRPTTATRSPRPLFRAGVRTFNRSLKSHRRRGLYCGTGDCANCLVTVDGVPGERACVTAVRDGMRVARETGWPRTERDALAINDRLHRAMPVGFYYKVFVRPRWAWAVAERVIRRATGTGHPSGLGHGVHAQPTRFVRVDVLVIGGGVAGLAAAAPRRRGSGAARRRGTPRRGTSPIPRRAIGDRAPGDRGARRRRPRSSSGTPRSASTRARRCRWSDPTSSSRSRPTRVIVATGALEAHGVFPGNDLPGVWLARGAARMAAAHGVAPRRAGRRRREHGGGLDQSPRRSARPASRSRWSRGRVLEARGSKQVSLGHGAHARGPPGLRLRRARALARLGAARHACCG